MPYSYLPKGVSDDSDGAVAGHRLIHTSTHFIVAFYRPNYALLGSGA